MRQHQDGREGGGEGDEYRAGEPRLCACAQERASEREGGREGERESTDGGGKNQRRKEGRGGGGGGLCSETETNDHEHQTTHISTQSQRYRKEDQIGTRVHSGEQRGDSSERERGRGSTAAVAAAAAPEGRAASRSRNWCTYMYNSLNRLISPSCSLKEPSGTHSILTHSKVHTGRGVTPPSASPCFLPPSLPPSLSAVSLLGCGWTWVVLEV